MSEKTHYTNAELKILHYLKRHHGTVRSKDGLSVAHRIARDLNMTRVAVVPVLRNLENACVLVRTNAGYAKSAIIKVELIDKDMELPPLPIIPAINIMVENRELEERIIARSDGPSADDILDALLFRIEELQGQVDKLQEIIGAQQEEMEKAQRRENRPKPSEHLMGRVRDSLSPEQWEGLRRKGTNQ